MGPFRSLRIFKHGGWPRTWLDGGFVGDLLILPAAEGQNPPGALLRVHERGKRFLGVTWDQVHGAAVVPWPFPEHGVTALTIRGARAIWHQ